jgi:hypothetical protein
MLFAASGFIRVWADRFGVFDAFVVLFGMPLLCLMMVVLSFSTEKACKRWLGPV